MHGKMNVKHSNIFAYDILQYYLDVGISGDSFFFHYFVDPSSVVQLHHRQIFT